MASMALRVFPDVYTNDCSHSINKSLGELSSVEGAGDNRRRSLLNCGALAGENWGSPSAQWVVASAKLSTVGAIPEGAANWLAMLTVVGLAATNGFDTRLLLFHWGVEAIQSTNMPMDPAWNIRSNSGPKGPNSENDGSWLEMLEGWVLGISMGGMVWGAANAMTSAWANVGSFIATCGGVAMVSWTGLATFWSIGVFAVLGCIATG